MSVDARRAEWRRGREAEGDGLLNRYRGNPIVGSNPTVSASPFAVVRKRSGYERIWKQLSHQRDDRLRARSARFLRLRLVPIISRRRDKR